MSPAEVLNHLLAPTTQSIATLSPIALLLAPVLGALTSFGPCSAARMLTLAATSGSSAWRNRTAFVLGTMTGSVLIVFAIALVGAATLQSRILYAAVGLLAIWSGVRAIWTADAVEEHSHERQGFGGHFLAGSLFSALLQPCCTPILFIAAGVAAVSPVYAIGLVIGFGFGHALPPIVIASLTQRLSAIPGLQLITRTAIGAIALACGAAYVAIA